LRQQRKESLKARQMALISNQTEEPVLYEMVSAEIHQQVFAAINQLPPKCRRIFHMLYMEGKDFQQIAAELQLSVSTIHNQKARGIRLLREQINPGFITLFLFFLIIF
ncbi:MAG: sigma-70 family RNA polymerase sigma factor, partial [Sphingobacteriales bacterium]|nr:sigma-70 family RNA polymerase sigma factor [Sphingobacteriales bacterium]